MKKIRVTVWNENVHEQQMENVRAIYPKGIHGCIADVLNADPRFTATPVSLDMPEQGLPDDLLNQTDVLFWWGHIEPILGPANRHNSLLAERCNLSLYSSKVVGITL